MKLNPDRVNRLFLLYYRKACNMDHIKKPLAWALYQTWKDIDRIEEPKKRRIECR